MYSWYRRGFIVNVVMALIGVIIASYEIFVYTVNRKEYYKMLDRLTKLKGINVATALAYSRSNSKTSVYGGAETMVADNRPRIPLRIPIRNFYNRDDDENSNLNAFQPSESPVSVNIPNRAERSKLYRPLQDGEDFERERLN